MGERDTHAIPTLLLLLKSQRPQVRSAAISSLGTTLNFSGTRATASAIVPSLIAMLDDPNAEVQATTARTLGHIGESAKSAVPKLIPLLKHPDRAIRLFSAYALGEMGKSAAQSAIPKLVPLLKDSDLDVRSSATDALIELGYLKGKRRTPRLARPAQPVRLEVEQLQSLPPLQINQSEEVARLIASVRQVFVQELKHIQRPDGPVEYRVMVAGDGSLTKILPMTQAASQILPRLEIVKRVQSANPDSANTNVASRAFRVFVSSDSIHVLAE
jgi:HEAT repeat protein